MEILNQLLSQNPNVQSLLDVISQSSKIEIQETEYRTLIVPQAVNIGGRGNNPSNWEEILKAVESFNLLVKTYADNLLLSQDAENEENENKLSFRKNVVMYFTIFALIAIGGFASYANISNVLHLVGEHATVIEKIVSAVFGVYLSFCFAYFAILGEHSKTNVTAYMLGIDVVAHFLVAKGVISFDNNIIVGLYVTYYAAQLIVSMTAIAKLAKNADFMSAIFGEQTA